MMNKDSDRLGWLRKIRDKIVRKCDNDPRAMGIYFRKIQQKHKERILICNNMINSAETVSALEKSGDTGGKKTEKDF